MNNQSSRILAPLLRVWEAVFIRYPWLVILLFSVASAWTLSYTVDHLKVNTNTSDIISLDLPFQKNRLALEEAFPQDLGSALLVVEAETPEETSRAVRKIAERARSNSSDFTSVYVPGEGDFFDRNGLLYLSLEELEDLSEQLAKAQPFIGRLSGDNTLRGLFGVVGEALTHSESDLELELDPVLEKIREALDAAREGRPYRVSWRQLMTPDATGFGITQRLILIRPVLNYEEVMPAEKAIGAIDSILEEVLQGDLANVRVRKTGEVVLEHEEMETISTGVTMASFASMALVCLTLWVAYRSVKLVIATLISLTMGLIFSLGFATIAIGQLNLISIGFAVLFIGMGDAYSSHFCLRYRELILEGREQRAALRETLTSTGSALTLSAVTAAIGLFAFIPTSYSGVAELGIIAGASMFIALATTFTVLPALMNIMPIRRPRNGNTDEGDFFLSSNWPLRHAGPVRIVTVLLTLGATLLMSGVWVDFNPINLRDPETESVSTFKDLLDSSETTPLTLASLAHSEAEVLKLEEEYLQLPSVEKVISLLDLIPENQDEKLQLIADLSLVMMGTDLDHFPMPGAGGASRESLARLGQAVSERRAQGDESAALEALYQSIAAFERSLDLLPSEEQATLLNRLQESLLAPLPEIIHEFGKSLSAQPVELSDLPQDIVERWLSPSGLYRLQIYPKKDLDDLQNLRELILEAKRVDPDVTDLPVTYLESMETVVQAFQEAFAIAFLATTLILLIVLRSVRDTVLVLLPLLLASLFTAAGTVLMDIPFNFANIIALPLLFGLGVDSGIHIAHRLHELEKSHTGNLLDTSEAKGVFYGALTTVFSFASLALTSHKGTASMGLLLSIGLMLTLVCALVVLPAFSHVRVKKTP